MSIDLNAAPPTPADRLASLEQMAQGILSAVAELRGAQTPAAAPSLISDVLDNPVVKEAEQLAEETVVPALGPTAVEQVKGAALDAVATGNATEARNTVAEVGELLEDHHVAITDALKAHTNEVSQVIKDAFGLLGTSNDAKIWRRRIFAAVLAVSGLFVAAMYAASLGGDKWAQNNLDWAVGFAGFVVTALLRSGVD